MSEYNYDSYCGLYCGACDIMTAYRTGHKSKFAGFWDKSTLEAYQKCRKYSDYTDEDLKLVCYGCKSDKVFINCRACLVKDCAIEKNIEHCIDCSDYPCKLITDLKDGVKIMPHLVEKEDNLKRIKQVGLQSWLKEQDEKWKCPDCKAYHSWYAIKCNSCGRSLKDKNYKFSWINSIIFKIVIKTVLKKNFK